MPFAKYLTWVPELYGMAAKNEESVLQTAIHFPYNPRIAIIYPCDPISVIDSPNNLLYALKYPYNPFTAIVYPNNPLEAKDYPYRVHALRRDFVDNAICGGLGGSPSA